MTEIRLKTKSVDEARAHMRLHYPGCVLWPTSFGFDVIHADGSLSLVIVL